MCNSLSVLFSQTLSLFNTNPRHDSWHQALKELEHDSSINEVILSGGDPLMLSDSELGGIITTISSFEHIKRIRIHTRLPVVIPNRINDKLLDWIKQSSAKIIIVLHINHPQEINQELSDKLSQLIQHNCLLLNQSVLLRKINNDSNTLVALSEALFASGVIPYYLHILDKVEGAAHFEVPKNQARILMKEVANQLPGYLVPKLVEEVPGKQAKSLICY